MEVDDQVIEQPEEKSIEDTIRESIASIKADKAPSEPVEAAPIDGETAQQAADRTRDEARRFAKGEKRPTLTLPEKAKPEGTAIAEVPAVPIVAATKAPERWSPEAKEKWATVPPEVQQAVLKREQEAHRALTTQDEERLFGKRIKDLTQPYMATLNAEGGTPEDAYRQFLNYAHIMRTASPETKRNELLKIAQAYSVDLGIPLQQGAAPTAPAFQPQQVSQLVQAELSSWHQRQEQAQIHNEIETFAADPANTHYETVKSVMAALLQNGKAETLKQAYDQAIWADPDIRSTLTAQQLSDAEQKRLTDARIKADAAKRAGGSLSGGPGNATALNGRGSAAVPLEETIRAAYRESQGRV